MEKSNDIAAYILCGGKSLRMKSEKGLMLYKGKPFILWIIEAVMPITSNILLVTSNRDYSFLGLPMIEDAFVNKGPVGGIYTALQHSRSVRNLILSCDVPKITTELLRILTDETKELTASVTFFRDDKNDYPLIGVYKKQALKAFGDAISTDKLKLRTLVTRISPHVINLNCEQKLLVANINSIAELEELNQYDQRENL